MQLERLGTANSDVEARAIVVHAVWYVCPERVHTTCLIGRSEGCFAMTNSSRDAVMAELGAARLIYTDKG
jgi:L,D-transpeptidase catalytic domain